MPPFSFMFRCQNTSEYEIRTVLSNLQLGVLHKIDLTNVECGQFAVVHYANLTNADFIRDLNMIDERRSKSQTITPKRIRVNETKWWHVYKYAS